ncbi:hypothetical protein [Mangrovicoccus ximenensis]|uniref:hypothetical protein n=1 Tax=Mangrovicoccus ximenensis TaxID=1911570 RepID=UPI00191BD81C|nr:hypothetical protein [Mangrovicoccus ximenensis]
MTSGHTVICAGSGVSRDKLAIADGGTENDVRNPEASANTHQHGATSRESGGPLRDCLDLP